MKHGPARQQVSGLVSARAYPHAGGSCTLNLWGSRLLRDPSQFSLGPQGTQFPWCATRRHCESLDLWRRISNKKGLTLLPNFSLQELEGGYSAEVRETELTTLHYTNTITLQLVYVYKPCDAKRHHTTKDYYERLLESTLIHWLRQCHHYIIHVDNHIGMITQHNQC